MLLFKDLELIKFIKCFIFYLFVLFVKWRFRLYDYDRDLRKWYVNHDCYIEKVFKMLFLISSRLT